MSSSRISLIIFMLLLCFKSNATSYFKFQHAGEIGYYAFGLGYRFNNEYSLEVFQGIVPKYIGGKRLEIISIKNNYHFLDFEFLSVPMDWYAGGNIYNTKGKRYESSKETDFPANYYRIGSLRGSIYIGGNFSFASHLRHSFYFESGINDIVLLNYIKNRKTINPAEYVSLGIGYRYIF